MTKSAIKFTPQVLLGAPRRSSGIPNAAGTLVLYSVQSYSFDSHSKTSEIRVLEIANGQSTLITNDEKASDPHWIGEGNEIVWLKEEKKGNTSFIVADVRNGVKYTAGSISGPVSNIKLKVLERGKIAIAVTGQQTPEGELYNPENAPKSYSSARIYDSLFVRHWDKYVTPQKSSIWYGVLQTKPDTGRWSLSSFHNALKGTKYESPMPPFGGTDHFDIATTGLIFISKDPTLNPATNTKADCYFIPLPSFTEAPSEPRIVQVDDDLKGAAASPVFGPDGESFAFLKMKHNGYESDKTRIIFVSSTHDLTGTELFKTADGKGGWDRSPNSILITKAGTMYLLAENIGRGVLYQTTCSPGNELPTKLTNSGYISDMKPLSTNSTSLFLTSTSFIDNSLYSILDTSSQQTVVSSNSRTGTAFGLSPGQVSETWWQGSKFQIHAWVIKPSDFNPLKKYPLAYLIHGGPQGSWNDQWSTRWNPAVFAEQGYVVVTPNPTGSTGYGQELTDSIRGSWGGLPYEDLVFGFKHIKSELAYVDTDRAVALGASYGGFMCNWIQSMPLGREFKALVTHDGVFSMSGQLASEEQYFPLHDLKGPIWTSQASYDAYDPSRHTKHWATPHLIIHNELDYRLTISEGLAAFNILQMRGIPSKFLSFPDENHWVLKQENSLVWHRTVLDWINHYVGLPKPEGCGVEGEVRVARGNGNGNGGGNGGNGLGFGYGGSK
ncbi:MAG: hypothetical protein M1834_002787 [Cirrosporium novae-zelandiae]|nr:MAG: hypothetical protein M1834_002787 [Cirrosporium novae-zelandiae]